MNRNKKTRTLVLTAILIAITLLLGITPIGFIRIIPGFIEITVMCIPVIVGALTLGWRSGLALGMIFAITSIITAFTGSPLGAMLLEESIIKTLVLLIAPRLLVPVAAYGVYRLMRTKRDMVNIGVASAVGSAVNTVVFLAMLGGMFENIVAAEIFTFAAFLNGTVEAALAAFVCPPIVRALKKSLPPMIAPQAQKETMTQ